MPIFENSMEKKKFIDLKKLIQSKNPTVAFRTAKDWKSGSRIIEAQEWFKF